MNFIVTFIILTPAASAAGCEEIMRSLPKHFIVFLLLLVLLSIAVHVVIDIQHADNGLQAKWDICLLHAAVLLTVIGMARVSSTITKLPHQTTSSRQVPIILPFRPPIF